MLSSETDLFSYYNKIYNKQIYIRKEFSKKDVADLLSFEKIIEKNTYTLNHSSAEAFHSLYQEIKNLRENVLIRSKEIVNFYSSKNSKIKDDWDKSIVIFQRLTQLAFGNTKGGRLILGCIPLKNRDINSTDRLDDYQFWYSKRNQGVYSLVSPFNFGILNYDVFEDRYPNETFSTIYIIPNLLLCKEEKLKEIKSLFKDIFYYYIFVFDFWLYHLSLSFYIEAPDRFFLKEDSNNNTLIEHKDFNFNHSESF